MVRHAQRDGCHRHLERHALLGDGTQRSVEVEAGVQADPRAGGDRGDDVEQAEDVHRRSRDLEPVPVGEPERGDPVLHAVAQRPVRVAHRFREAGGSRAEHQHRIGVGVVDDGTATVRRRRRRVVEREHRDGRERGGERRAPGLVAERDVGRHHRGRVVHLR